MREVRTNPIVATQPASPRYAADDLFEQGRWPARSVEAACDAGPLEKRPNEALRPTPGPVAASSSFAWCCGLRTAHWCYNDCEAAPLRAVLANDN